MREHLFLLQEAWADYQTQQQTIARCDTCIEEVLAEFPVQGTDEIVGERKRSTNKHAFSFDAQTMAYRLTGVDLAAIDGIGPLTAMAFISEVGCN